MSSNKSGEPTSDSRSCVIGHVERHQGLAVAVNARILGRYHHTSSCCARTGRGHQPLAFNFYETCATRTRGVQARIVAQGRNLYAVPRRDIQQGLAFGKARGLSI